MAKLVNTYRLGFTSSTDPFTFTIPEYVTSVTFECWGAWGGDGSTAWIYPDGSMVQKPNEAGGPGGYVKGTLAVTAGDIYYLYPGNSPLNPNGNPTSITGASAGGSGQEYSVVSGIYQGETSSGAGGDGSDIRYGGTTLADRIMVAGGGGGGRSMDQWYTPSAETYNAWPQTPNPPFVFPGTPLYSPNNVGIPQGSPPYTTGYYSGVDFGAPAATAASGAQGGKAGTGSAGGAAGTNSGGTAATAGALGLGGNGGSGTAGSDKMCGGGGGGGYYGGGGGAVSTSAVIAGAGGGGSNFIGASFTSTTNIDAAGADASVYGIADNNVGLIRLTYVQVPNPPTVSNTLVASGGNIPANAPITFSWVFSSQAPGVTQSGFDIEYSSDGGSTWTVLGKPSNIANSYTFAANFFTAGTSYEIKVRVYDNYGDASNYSSAFSFSAVTPIAAPTITAPTTGELITSGNFTVTWTIPSGTENSWQVQVYQDDGTILADSGIVASALLTYNVSIALGDSVPGPIHTRVRYTTTASGGVFSEWDVVDSNLNFDPPDAPGVSMTTDNDTGRVIFGISNPTTSYATVYNDVFRTDITNAGDEIRIATRIPPNSTFVDYTAASGITYHYRVRAYSAVGGFTDTV